MPNAVQKLGEQLATNLAQIMPVHLTAHQRVGNISLVGPARASLLCCGKRRIDQNNPVQNRVGKVLPQCIRQFPCTAILEIKTWLRLTSVIAK